MAEVKINKRQTYTIEYGDIDETTPMITDGLIAEFPFDGTTTGISHTANISPSEGVWVIGTSGTQGPFTQNGSTSENAIISKENPWGIESAIWATESNDTASSNDGGFNYNSAKPIDNTKTYRLSVWIRRENPGNGRTYFGLRSNTDGVLNLSGSVNNNAYFYAPLITQKPEMEDQWVLFVYYIHHKDYVGTASSVDRGIYELDGTHFIEGSDYKWSQAAVTSGGIRSYLFYSTSISERHYWYDPRMEIYDETSSTIEEILKGSPNNYHPSIETNISLDPSGVGISEYVENITNNPSGTLGITPYDSSWDSNLNIDAYSTLNWGSGYNSGVNNPTVGYHARWVYEGYDGGLCQKHTDLNTQFGEPHRWMGISQVVTTDMSNLYGFEENCYITLSWLQKTSTIAKSSYIGLHHKENGISTFSGAIFSTNNSKPYIWERFTKTIMVTSEWDENSSIIIYCYGNHGDEGIIWYDNIQLEGDYYKHGHPFVDGVRNNTSELELSMKTDDISTYTIIGKLFPYSSSDGVYNNAYSTDNDAELFRIIDEVNTGTISIKYSRTISPGNGYLYLNPSGSFGVIDVSGSCDWVANDDIIFCVTKTGTTFKLKIYVNGIFENEITTTCSINNILSSISFGGDENSSCFNGLYNDIFIYNKVLTDSEINTMLQVSQKITNVGNLLTNINENITQNLWKNINFESTIYEINSGNNTVTLETDIYGTYHQMVVNNVTEAYLGYSGIYDINGINYGDVYIFSAWVWVSEGHSFNRCPLGPGSATATNISKDYDSWSTVPTNRWVYCTAEGMCIGESMSFYLYFATSGNSTVSGTIKWRNVCVRKKGSSSTKISLDTLNVNEINETLIFTKYSGGYGTIDEPYLISTVEDLRKLSEDANPLIGIPGYIGDWVNTHFTQINDIDMSVTENWNGGEGWEGIGTLVAGYEFNGSSYKGLTPTITISNLYINRVGNYQGFINRGIGCFVKNLIFKDCTFIGGPDSSGISCLGYFNNDSLSDATIKYIENIKAINVTIEAKNVFGAVVAYMRKGTVTRCAAINCSVGYYARTDSTYSPVGGLVGYFVNGAYLTESFTYNVTVYSKNPTIIKQYTGGLVGLLYGEVNNCYVLGGSVTANQAYTGGIIGRYFDTTTSILTNCFTSTDVDSGGYSNTGAVCGSYSVAGASNLYYDSTVSNVADGSGTGTATPFTTAVWATKTLVDINFSTLIWSKSGTYPDLINNPLQDLLDLV